MKNISFFIPQMLSPKQLRDGGRVGLRRHAHRTEDLRLSLRLSYVSGPQDLHTLEENFQKNRKKCRGPAAWARRRRSYSPRAAACAGGSRRGLRRSSADRRAFYIVLQRVQLWRGTFARGRVKGPSGTFHEENLNKETGTFDGTLSCTRFPLTPGCDCGREAPSPSTQRAKLAPSSKSGVWAV